MPAETRQAIVVDLKAGKSQYSTAKRHGVSSSTVNAVAKAEGIEPNVRPTKNASEARTARRIFDLEQRLALSDAAFEILTAELGASSLKDWSISYGILVDKRRLEEGKATERHEYTDSDRELITRRVDELAARRGTRMAQDADASPGEATAI